MLQKAPEKTRILRNQLGHPKFAPLKAIDLSFTLDEKVKPNELQAAQKPEAIKSEPEPKENASPAPSSTENTIMNVIETSEDPVLHFLESRAAFHTASMKDDQEWLSKTAFNLRSALNRYGMSAKSAEGRPPILTPNAALIRLQGGPDLTLNRLEKRADELYTTDGLKILSLLPGEKMVSVSIERPDRQILYTTSVFAKLLRDGDQGEKVFIGIREENGEPMYFDPFANPHTLIAGATGSGKSVLVQNMLFILHSPGNRIKATSTLSTVRAALTTSHYVTSHTSRRAVAQSSTPRRGLLISLPVL